MTPLSRSAPGPKICSFTPKICSSAPSNSSNEKSGKPFSHRRFDRAEQPNKLHPFIFRRTSKGTARRRATVVGHCIRQRTHNQSALSLIDHDLVFVVDRHVPLSALGPNASCLHPSFNYSQNAFFGQGPQLPLGICSSAPKICSSLPSAPRPHCNCERRNRSQRAPRARQTTHSPRGHREGR
jgi:hypothetical protein